MHSIQWMRRGEAGNGVNADQCLGEKNRNLRTQGPIGSLGCLWRRYGHLLRKKEWIQGRTLWRRIETGNGWWVNERDTDSGYVVLRLEGMTVWLYIGTKVHDLVIIFLKKNGFCFGCRTQEVLCNDIRAVNRELKRWDSVWKMWLIPRGTSKGLRWESQGPNWRVECVERNGERCRGNTPGANTWRH